jgi:hypothetical protein
MVTAEMFGGQRRIDEAETARAGWGDTSETRQPQRRDSRAMVEVCSCAEKIRIKSLEMVGVVRDNAVQVDLPASRDSEKGMASVKLLGLVRTDALQFLPQPSPRLLPASSPPPGEMRPYDVRSPALLLAQGIGGDAQALHQFAGRILQIYPSLPPIVRYELLQIKNSGFSRCKDNR